MKRIWWYSVGLVLVLGVAVVLAAAGYLYHAGRQPVTSGSDSFVINPGTGVKGVASDLADRRILEEPYTFIAWAYYREQTTRIHAGEYFIPPDITVAGLLDLFVSGKVIQRNVTLIEGWTFEEFREALYAAEKLRIETRGLTGEQIMARLNDPDRHPEGRFFPDTYSYTAAMSDLDLLKRAHDAMERILEDEWRNRDEATVLESRDDALVLASIIEKETGRADERRTIAAVFHNRLNRGMRLQTDPTVIYGLGNSFDGNLTRAHLRSDTPYNTYTRGGLPPTPIAMPGRASIHAALNPGPSPALYFVSRGDGSHVFSNTLEEHNRAVVRYQLNGDGSASDSSGAEKAGEPADD